MIKNQICIPKLMCVNTYFIILILAIVIIYTIRMKQKTKEIIKKVYVDTGSKIIENRYPQDQRPNLYRQLYDKLEEPKREYDNRINIRTRGELPSYQNIGYVYREESDPSYNPDEKNRVALYGRPEYSGADKWEYYITDDDIKITLDNTREIYTGDKVSIKGFAGEWTAHVNEYKEFKYIPFVY